MIYYFITLIIIVIYIVRNYMKSEKKTSGVIVIVRVGSNGTGKTFITVQNAISDYKRLYRLYKLNKKKYKKPVIYSTIPIRITKNKYAKVLKREHILMREKFEKDCIPIVVWDEVGLSCNQYSYDDENIITKNVNDSYQCAEVFIRMFRHVYDDGNNNCRLYLTDNSTGGIVVNIRRRFTRVDVLEGLKVNRILPFYKLFFMRKYVMDDSEVQEKLEDKSKYYFGFILPRSITYKKYSETTYKELYEKGFVSSLPFEDWSECPNLLCCYVPDIRSTYEEKMERKRKRELSVR